MSELKKIGAKDVLDKGGVGHDILNDPNVAHLVVHRSTVLGSNTVPGLHVDVEEIQDGINAKLTVDEGAKIQKPVHMCFGMLGETGIQRIEMHVHVKKGAEISILAHCVFPNGVDLQHLMNADIKIEDDARYSYFERHVHGSKGGVKVVPKAKIHLGKRARFSTEFELLKGRVGEIHVEYVTHSQEDSVLEMTARINGKADDIIDIKEIGHLEGDRARGVLNTRIAVRDQATAEVYNRLTASAAFARGHVDCKEIIRDQGRATAIPIVEVNHPKAHITHEAAIGNVDTKQLETLMSRGLDEDEASELIIEGLLS